MSEDPTEETLVKGTHPSPDDAPANDEVAAKSRKPAAKRAPRTRKTVPADPEAAENLPAQSQPASPHSAEGDPAEREPDSSPPSSSTRQETSPDSRGEQDHDSPGQDRDEEKPRPKVEVPELVDLNALQDRPLAELHRLAVEASLRVAGIRSKHQLVFELLCYFGRHGSRIEAEGALEMETNSAAFLRCPRYSFAPLPEDPQVSQNLVRKLALRPGTKIRGVVRTPRDREKYITMDEVISIEGTPLDQWKPPTPFDKLTPLFPKDRIVLESSKGGTLPSRIVDLMAPLGKGQRGLIVAPPRGGKTLMLKDIAASIRKNHPDIELIVLLLDERPEEVTDFCETVDVDVFSSTFDEQPRRHIQVAEMVSERAKRLVELGKDVVILLDSLTRLARGYNQVQGGGRIMSGGIGSRALEKPRKFFGAARNVEEGGSLTILATALVETENRMDEVIFEEFKGTGNMELSLDREMVEKRIFPAIHLQRSGTRNDEKLYHPDEFRRITVLRRELAQLPAVEALEVLTKNIRHTTSNAELLLKGLK